MKNEHGQWWVYEVNDCDSVVARSLEEAVAFYADEMNLLNHEVDALEPMALSDDRMDSLNFIDDPEDPEHSDGSRPFRQQLANLVAAGLKEPELFATTEY